MSEDPLLVAARLVLSPDDTPVDERDLRDRAAAVIMSQRETIARLHELLAELVEAAETAAGHAYAEVYVANLTGGVTKHLDAVRFLAALDAAKADTDAPTHCHNCNQPLDDCECDDD